MTTGVYIARDAAGVVLYVGASRDIEKRLAAHRGTSPWWGAAASIEKIPTETRFLALDVERQKILELRPTHNIMSQGGSKKTTKVRGPVVVPRTVMFARIIEEHGTVANLAKAIGVDHQTLSQVWRGVSYPSSKAIARLMVVTGLSFDDLFAVQVIGEATDPAEWREWRGWRSESKALKPRAVA